MKISEFDALSKTKKFDYVKELEAKIQKLEKDRSLYRDFFKEKIRRQLQALSENKHYSPKCIVERIISVVSKVEPYNIWWN